MNYKTVKTEEEKSKIENIIGKGMNESAQEIYRVVIQKDASLVLDELAKKANEGFDAGLITKSDVANYIFTNLAPRLTESDFRSLRSLHFDERKVLSGLLRKSEGTAELPEELKRAIREHCGIGDREKKRANKTTSEAT
jgi:hypothetical protein